MKKSFSKEEAQLIGSSLGIEWNNYSREQFKKGLDVELEHGFINSATNVTNDDMVVTGKIAMAHLNEFPDYYDRLEIMEKEAELFWEKKFEIEHI